MPIEELQQYLDSLEPGPLTSDQRSEVEGMLSECWPSLDGSGHGGMHFDKLVGRTERMEWVPPVVKFQIERHGGTVKGSSRAEIQRWAVNLESETAKLDGTTHRQVRPMSKRLDVNPIAQEIAVLIQEGSIDPRLTWYGGHKLKVEVGKIIPNGFPKATVAGRRKRLRKALIDQLAGDGWQPKTTGTHCVFERMATAHTGSSENT